MRFMKVFTRLFALILAFVISCIGMIVKMPEIPGLGSFVRMKSAFLAQNPIYEGNTAFLGFFCLFLLIVAYFIFCMLCSRNKPIVTIDTDRGKIRIVDSAVRKYLLTTLSKMSSIQVRFIQVAAAKKGLLVRVYVRVRSAQHLNDVKESIIERIQNALGNELGVPTVGNIEVIVDDFEAVRTLAAKSNAENVSTKTEKSEHETAIANDAIVGEQHVEVEVVSPASADTAVDDESSKNRDYAWLEEAVAKTVDGADLPEKKSKENGQLGLDNKEEID